MRTLFLVALVVISCWLVFCQSSGVQMVTAYPWAGCGVGSFVQYKMTMPAPSRPFGISSRDPSGSRETDGVGNGRMVQERQTVIEVKPGHVLVESSALTGEGWEPRGKMIVPLNMPRRVGTGAVTTTKEQVIIAGKTVQCKVIEGDGIKVWMSEEVPGGLVRRMSEGTVVLEVVDFKKK